MAAKRNIENELRDYFKANIGSRIRALAEEIAALKTFKAKLLGKPPAPAARTKGKLHWTQRPENKARMMKQLKRATAARKGSA